MPVSTDDVTLAIHVADDGSEAVLAVPAALPRDLVTADAAHTALADAQVELTEAVVKRVEELIDRCTDAKGDVTDVVAQATPPQHGEDGRVEWLVDVEADQPGSEQSSEPADQGKQSADTESQSHYGRSGYIIVREGDQIARIIEPTEGADGRDVQGKTLAARTGQPADISFDDTVRRDAQGVLIAQLEGVLHRNAEKISVRQVLEVEQDVDFSTGNIKFSGDVLVHKAVRDRFVIKAGGSVTVKGPIEAATIECEGDLYAKGGFAGREVGTAIVRRDLVGHYLDNIRGRVEGDLKIDKEIINCEFEIAGSVRSPHSTMIGGRYVITGLVEIATLGSDAAVATKLVLGAVPKLDPYLMQLEPFVKTLDDQSDTLVDEKRGIEQRAESMTSAERERQTELDFELSSIGTNRNKAKAVYEALSQKISSLRTVDLRVASIVYAGVVLNIGGHAYSVHTDTRGPLRITLNEQGHIIYQMTNADGKPLDEGKPISGIASK